MLFKYHDLSISANIHFSICNIGSFFLHGLNYSRLLKFQFNTAHCSAMHVRYCIINGFFQLVQIILQTTFYSTF